MSSHDATPAWDGQPRLTDWLQPANERAAWHAVRQAGLPLRPQGPAQVFVLGCARPGVDAANDADGGPAPRVA